MTFSQFWGSFGYLMALMIGVYLVAQKMPRRDHFALRMALCATVIFAYKFGFDVGLRSLELDEVAGLVVRTMDSFVLYMLSIAAVGVCFSCDIWAMLFCATAGYCMQHMSQRTYLLLTKYVYRWDNVILDCVALVVITAVFYVVLYRTLIRGADYRGTMLNSRVQVGVSFIAILITIFLNSFAMRAAAGMANVIGYIIFFSIITAVLVFYVEFGWLAAKKAELEKDMVSRMAEANREQYEIEKDITELINIKCHDLKHQFSMLDGQLSERQIAELSESINIYDSIFKTGNKALDIALTRKSLLCEKKGIKLTCVMDGEKLSFLTEEDIFSLFCNILDNAIEAVDGLTVESKRLICLSTMTQGGKIIVHEENYFDHDQQLRDGLPVTTKGDKRYHGFGLKSIKRICERYRGNCTLKLEDGIFEMELVFPMNQ